MKTLKLFVLLAAVLSFAGCTRIGPGHVGIKVSMSGSDKGVLESPVTTGWVFYNPFFSSVIEYPTNMQTVVWTRSKDEGKDKDESVTFTNKDSMAINADVSLNYYLTSDKVPAFYVKFLATDIENFTDGYLHTAARNCMNDYAGQYSIEQLMGDNKKFLEDTKQCIQKIVQPYGVVIDAFGFVGAPRPPEAVLQNINAKIQAEQIALQKQNEILQVEADAKKRVAEAEGNAKAQIAEAQGDAEANRLRTQSITPSILQSRLLDKWDGHYPDTLVSGSGSNFLLPLPKGN